MMLQSTADCSEWTAIYYNLVIDGLQ